ncbi:acetyl-CoA carboxylase biotin carboxyl carrier protein subunit [Paenalcaligenes niemegkensis]|uniref:acetyl-CoA carboxylase biotin carboxyl carrier protein subunit n=1 Tax=Paenalcaligenes niemegkensis TaxID=2895469 RepID=UPI001EE7F24C|nr:acetyl-CoA carboxylase biotin carboxyl carrier protein subunit [Paenalcaligenes niemegkensis]MCQ9618056.1 acetyl-CoA carboxylase biotin carboxyl carrier protein subunit [Paenalcaligenes niemegkensis]
MSSIEIKAELGGVISNILVSAGASVSAGDPVAVMEAMKLEILIEAGEDGIVQDIHVSVGDVVDEAQVIVTLVRQPH